MGTFSAKFLRAAKVAGELLGGSLYERYYGIDYASVLAIEAPVRPRRARPPFTSTARTSAAFDALCQERARTMAGADDDERARVRSWVAVNGAVIEQAQILTTQNLATLVARVEVTPATGWAELAYRCFVTVCRLVARAHRNPRPLPVVKDAAYAWRNALFFASLTGSGEQVGFEDRMHREVRAQPAHVRAALAPVLTGFAHVRAGGGFDQHGEARGGRRFLGWAPGGHWMLRPPGR
jgi:hypothetical protein